MLRERSKIRINIKSIILLIYLLYIPGLNITYSTFVYCQITTRRYLRIFHGYCNSIWCGWRAIAEYPKANF